MKKHHWYALFAVMAIIIIFALLVIFVVNYQL